MTVKFFSTECESGSGSSGSLSMEQVTKMGVIAPHVTTITIEYSSRFNKLPVEVLKMEGAEKDKSLTLADFDNADEGDFLDNKYINFDGTMHLKTDYIRDATNLEPGVFEYDFSDVLDEFKNVEGVGII